jgi:hypothetical protein
MDLGAALVGQGFDAKAIISPGRVIVRAKEAF